MISPANSSVAAIFSRLFDFERIDLSPEAAKSLLKIEFSQRDRDRMHELAVRNRESKLTLEEDQEFENFLLAGDLLGILHAKARMCLKTVEATS